MSYQIIDQKIHFLQGIKDRLQVDPFFANVQFTLCHRNLDTLLTLYRNSQGFDIWQGFNIENVTLTNSVSTLTKRGNANQASDSVGVLFTADYHCKNPKAQTLFYHLDMKELCTQNSQNQGLQVIDESTGFRHQ